MFIIPSISKCHVLLSHKNQEEGATSAELRRELALSVSVLRQKIETSRPYYWHSDLNAKFDAFSIWRHGLRYA